MADDILLKISLAENFDHSQAAGGLTFPAFSPIGAILFGYPENSN